MSVTIREYYSKRLKKKTFSYEIDITTQQTRIRETKRGFLTKTSAREEGERRELEIKKKSKQGYDIKDIITKDKNKITVKELLDLWLTTKKANVTFKTFSFYEFCISMIVKDIGKTKARSLKTEHIELAVNNLLEKGLSPTTASHYYTVLNIAFNWAIQRGYIVKNPCLLMKKPKKSKSELQVYNQKELDTLLKAIKNLTIFIPTMLASTTGMRLGEICGLTWKNIDLDNGFIQLQEQLQEINGSLHLIPLKSVSSKRKIILLDITIEALKELKEKQKSNKDYLGDNYKDKGFVVCQNNGEPYSPTYISRNYRRVLKDTKHKVTVDGNTKKLSLYEMLSIPLIRFHDLRHTHATLLLKTNTHPKIVADRLGHVDTRLVMDTYSHVLPDMQRDALNELNKMMNLKHDDSIK